MSWAEGRRWIKVKSFVLLFNFVCGKRFLSVLLNWKTRKEENEGAKNSGKKKQKIIPKVDELP
jgi:hypothetical protein